MSHWRPRRTGIPAMTMLAAYGLTPLALAHAHAAWPIVAACAIGGLGIEIFNIPWFTAIQRQIPPHLQARISSLDFLVSYGMAPIGLAIMPLAISHLGATTVLTGCGLLTLATAATLSVPGMAYFRDPASTTPQQAPVPSAGCLRVPSPITSRTPTSGRTG